MATVSDAADFDLSALEPGLARDYVEVNVRPALTLVGAKLTTPTGMTQDVRTVRVMVAHIAAWWPAAVGGTSYRP